MGFHHLVNTAQFSYTGRDFHRNGRKYTKAPYGSRDYFQFWEQEDHRCRYGYKVADLWIPGRMYFWLNHFPINRVPEEVRLRVREQYKRSGQLVDFGAVEKEIGFPGFHEVHYEWWNLKHIAWYGGSFMGVESPGNRHMACLKTRGAGWSYLEACDAVYNYNFIHGSKSYFFAGSLPYLEGDAIMDKVQAGLDWINEHSPYWKQNRQRFHTLDHQRASFFDAAGTEKGSFSEIISQVIDKPKKTRGKRGRKISFEEGGSFPNMEEALEIALGSIREGTIYVGQCSVFGTGGEQGPGIQGLDNVFNNPEAWDMLVLPNVWEDGMQHTPCGYFVPCWRANSWFMDEDGNVEVEDAIKADDIEREKKRKSPRPKDLDRRKAEYPRSPREALQRMTGNGYNIAEIQAQIKRIQSDKAVQGLIRHGRLRRDPERGVVLTPQPKHIALPIEDFPHSQAEGRDLKGCVSTIQKPWRDPKGKVPEGMYILVFDGYAKEKAEDQTSLWTFQIYKQENPYDNTYIDVPVFWYAGRPARYYDNHDIMFMAAEMYNCDIQGEIAGGGQSVVTYARERHLLHKLKHSPESLSNKENQGRARENSYLMDMSTDRKSLGITYHEDWHVAPRAITDKGHLVLNIHHVYDIAYLREMEKFDPTRGNYDRISCGIVYMYERKEHYINAVKQRIEKRAFYDRQLFGDQYDYSEDGVTTPY
jgi:hypothetical protein